MVYLCDNVMFVHGPAEAVEAFARAYEPDRYGTPDAPRPFGQMEPTALTFEKVIPTPGTEVLSREWPMRDTAEARRLWRRTRWGTEHDIEACRTKLGMLEGEEWLRYDYSTALTESAAAVVEMVRQHPDVTIEHLSSNPVRPLEPYRRGTYRRLSNGRHVERDMPGTTDAFLLIVDASGQPLRAFDASNPHAEVPEVAGVPLDDVVEVLLMNRLVFHAAPLVTVTRPTPGPSTVTPPRGDLIGPVLDLASEGWYVATIPTPGRVRLLLEHDLLHEWWTQYGSEWQLYGAPDWILPALLADAQALAGIDPVRFLTTVITVACGLRPDRSVEFAEQIVGAGVNPPAAARLVDQLKESGGPDEWTGAIVAALGTRRNGPQ